MTLYVEDIDDNGWVTDSYREATWQERKRADGWEDCPTCRGTGEVGGCSTGCPCAKRDIAFCPDCADGLVPPDWMVVAAADALAKATFDHQWVQGRGLDWWNTVYQQVTTVLVAAARKGRIDSATL